MSKFPYIVACIGDEIVGYTYASTFRERQAYNWCVETSIYINEKLVEEEKNLETINDLIQQNIEETE